MKLDTNATNLKCPKCVEEKKDSKMHITAEHVEAKPNVFWDSTGQKHFHIVDVCLETIQCSRGHTFLQVSAAKCNHCEWTAIDYLKMLIQISTGTIEQKTLETAKIEET